MVWHASSMSAHNTHTRHTGYTRVSRESRNVYLNSCLAYAQTHVLSAPPPVRQTLTAPFPPNPRQYVLDAIVRTDDTHSSIVCGNPKLKEKEKLRQTRAYPVSHVWQTQLNIFIGRLKDSNGETDMEKNSFSHAGYRHKAHTHV